MKTISLSLSETQMQTLQHTLKHFTWHQPQHSLFQVKLNPGTITAYHTRKVVFQGTKALAYAQPFIKPSKDRFPSCGSDEVGTGDYFGPVCVCACYVDEKQAQWLAQFNITDSKQLSDAYILNIAPQLQKKLTHSLLVCDNVTYNRIHRTQNLNSIKANLHHTCFYHLKNKLTTLPSLCVVDQFMDPKRYYQVLTNDYGITHLHFETKAEANYLAVACGAIIARYSFLVSLQQLSAYANIQLPKGASAHVDDVARQLLKKDPDFNLETIAKVHFVNTKRILEP